MRVGVRRILARRQNDMTEANARRHVSHTYEPFRPEPSGGKLHSVLMLAYSSSLHKVNNASSVKKALQLFTKPEKLEGDNKYKCFR